MLGAGFYWAISDAEPAVPAYGPPTPSQVLAARKLFNAAQESRESGTPAKLSLTDTDLQAIAAILSPRLAPNRLGLRVKNDEMTVTASRKIGPRWVNAVTVLDGDSQGVPPFRITLGLVTLPESLSREMIEQAGQRLANNPEKLPHFDGLIQSLKVNQDSVDLAVTMPDPGQLDAALRPDALRIAPARVGAIYCALADKQEAEPETSFTGQLQRAIAASRGEATDQGAALVALAMFVVDYRTSALVSGAEEAAKKCKRAPVATVLDGREDWASHWSLSAALTVTLGSDVALAMGEWKELADSAPGKDGADGKKPSGFSFSDVAADRSGYFAAQRLTNRSSAAAARSAVLKADDANLLPSDLTRRYKPMTSAEFAARYGDIKDPRFQAEIGRIDTRLRAAWP